VAPRSSSARSSTSEESVGQGTGDEGAIVSQDRHTLELLTGIFAVAQLEAGSEIPAWVTGGSLVSITFTHDEVSIVCAESSVPPHVEAVRGFRCLRVEGPLGFSETGVLESIARPLARASISIFAVSTYNTDYLLVARDDLEASLAALSASGHSVRRAGAT